LVANSKDKLRDIFNYYKVEAGLRTARKIITQIVDKTINLNENPRIGQIEELLKSRKQEFRYLISTNYKIIYYINRKTGKIVIANVFDTRQNPKKLRAETR
jgi:plasmid stabilization system protein ParE